MRKTIRIQRRIGRSLLPELESVCIIHISVHVAFSRDGIGFNIDS